MAVRPYRQIDRRKSRQIMVGDVRLVVMRQFGSDHDQYTDGRCRGDHGAD